MADAASGIQAGAMAASGALAGAMQSYVSQAGITLTMADIAVAVAASALGMIHAEKMPPVAMFAAWMFSAVCAVALGSACKDVTAWALDKPIPQSAAILGIIIAGFAMHPIVRWTGKRFGVAADSGLKRLGVDVGDTQ